MREHESMCIYTNKHIHMATKGEPVIPANTQMDKPVDVRM